MTDETDPPCQHARVGPGTWADTPSVDERVGLNSPLRSEGTSKSSLATNGPERRRCSRAGVRGGWATRGAVMYEHAHDEDGKTQN
eukprot:6262787-Prymnesium_polylepis.2